MKTAQDNPLLAIISEDMEVFRAEMETVDRISKKIGSKTSKIIRVVIGLLTCVSVYLLVLTFNMASDLGSMIGRLDDMYVEFGTISDEMNLVTGHVVNMGKNIRGMPTIVLSMRDLNGDVGAMQGAMTTVTNAMDPMSTNMGQIGTETTDMAHRFHNVQRSVNMMRQDVYHMMRPMTAVPR